VGCCWPTVLAAPPMAAPPMAPIGETVEQRPPGGTRSTLGPQVIKASAPSYGFGSGTREVAAKVFVSQEHSALTANPCSPGPATFTQPASVGPQVDGLKQSAPRFGFGTSTREHQSKVYISADHEKVSGGRFAPGPHYDFETGIGKQVDSKKASLPLFGFGSSTREHQSKVYISAEHEKVTGSGEGPGKNYLLKPTLGKQVLSYGPSGYQRHIRNGSQPSWVVGKAERFEADQPGQAPGPGAYRITPAVGAQVASNKPSLPRYGFGSSTRAHQTKVFISTEHAKVTGSRDAPGPGAYPMGSMTGHRNASSKQTSGSAWGFGTSQRFADVFAKPRAPGPGHYVI